MVVDELPFSSVMLIDNHQPINACRIPRREHKPHDSTHGMTDNRNVSKLAIADHLIKVCHDSGQNAWTEIGARSISAEAVDLHQVDSMRLRKFRRNSIPCCTRTR